MVFTWRDSEDEEHTVAIDMSTPELAGPRSMLIMMANQALAGQQ
jgi:hypothetical protein